MGRVDSGDLVSIPRFRVAVTRGRPVSPKLRARWAVHTVDFPAAVGRDLPETPPMCASRSVPLLILAALGYLVGEAAWGGDVTAFVSTGGAIRSALNRGV